MERKNNSEHGDVIEIIDLDADDDENKNESLPNVPDVILINDGTLNKNNKIMSVCMEKGMSPLVTTFVKDCLKIENSKGMSKCLKMLLRVYKRVVSDSKKLDKIDKLLHKGIRYLKDNPSQPFTHVKMVHDGLMFYGALSECEKQNEVKEPEENVELDTNVDTIEIEDNVGNLDTECDENTTISSSDEENIVSNIRNKIYFENSDIDTIRRLKNQSDKQKVNKHNRLDKDIFNLYRHSEQIEKFLDKINGSHRHKNKINEPNICIDHENNSLLVPIDRSEVEKELSTDEKIRQIENAIAACKKKIAHFEMKEVCSNTKNSPYLITSTLKANAVKLYKELCKLKGEEPVKRRKIRISVPEGFPSGPVGRLETLINNNISSNVYLLFPDFIDVYLCVKNANASDNLGWNKEKMLAEARALFEQCGRALQQWRQKRDWGDVISCVSRDELDEDPADKDPVLMAKLMQNRKLALAKENDVFERYTKMQTNCIPLTVGVLESDTDNEKSSNDKHDSDSAVELVEDNEESKSDDNIGRSSQEIAEESIESECPVKRIKLERVDHAAIFHNSLVIDISDSDSDSA